MSARDQPDKLDRVPLFLRPLDGQDPDGKYVIVKGSLGAGLGDKIRALAVGLLLARVTGRALWVDWNDHTYGDVGNLFPLLFNVSGLRTVDQCPEVATVKPEIWSGRLALPQADLRAEDLLARGVTWTGSAPPWDPIDAMRRYSWDASDLCDVADALIVTTMLSATPVLDALRRSGVLQDRMHDEFLLHQVLRDHLRFHPLVAERILRFMQQEQWAHRFVVGVHVRHASESAAARTMPTIAAYFEAVDRALAIHAHAIIFLATDNSDIVVLFQDRYGHERIMTTDKWFAEPGQSLHKNPLCPDGVGSAREALVDIGLLACSDFLVSLGNSSFSIVASALSVASAANREVLLPRQALWRRLLRRLKQRRAP